MEREFESLNDNEVLHVTRGRIVMENPTFRVSEFLDALAQVVSEQEEIWTEDSEGWFAEGLDCEVLRLNGQSWQRGRVRLRLEFCPASAPKLLRGDVPRRREASRDAGGEAVRESGRDAVRDVARDMNRESSRPFREDVYNREDTRRRPTSPMREDIYSRREVIYPQDDYDGEPRRDS
jgi:hypothetical protein